MKKNHKSEAWYYHALKKTFLVMRIVIVISLVCIMQSFALESFTQNSKISLSVKEMKLEDIMMRIEDQTKYRFAYNKTEIDVDKSYSVDINNAEIKELLNKLFSKGEINYNIIDRQIVLSSSKESSIIQQQKSVSGKVTDSSGGSLPGVSVVVKGTTSGTITDANGNFSLANIPTDAILKFSFIGMKIQEVLVGDKAVINVLLEEETIGIEEVVAIGYGSVKKSDLTGAVASVKMEGANSKANTNMMQALQGSLPGLGIGAVTTAGGDPSMLIRGQNTLSAGTYPLIVVDGVIFNGSLSDLNVNDIDRVDVLKDASSTAVFGSRSANGVIIITSKKGISEKPVFNFNSYHGIQQMSHKIKMADGDKYVQKLLDYRTAIGMESNPANIETYLNPLEIENYRNKTYTDWYDVLTRTAPISQYDISVSGKSSKTNYFLSGSYTDQKGVVLGDGFKRTTLRANFSNDINNWLTIGLNTTFTNKDYSGQAVDFTQYAAYASPLSTVYANKATGELNLYPQDDQLIINPLSFAKARDKEVGNDLFAILFTDIKIPQVKGLKYHFDFSNHLQFSKHNIFWGQDTYLGQIAPNGEAQKSYSDNKNWAINNILSFTREFNKHAIDATVLYSLEGSKSESSYEEAKNFSNEILGYNAMQLGSVHLGSSTAADNSSLAFMMRVSYVYDKRYLLTSTFRRDGFSGFSKGNKYATFPSVSLAWVISEEKFAKSLNLPSLLKLRISYGVNGNQALGSYGSLSQISTLNYAYGGVPSIGIYPSTLGNNDLTWEKTKSLNLGLNIGILKNRITTDIDIYKSTTKDLLVQRGLPAMTGYSSVWANLGEIQNKGIEIALNTINISKTDFNWSSKFSFSLNRNKIVHLYGSDSNKDGIEDDDSGNSWFIGKSTGAIYDYTLNGVYQLTDENIPSGFAPGDYRFKDIDGKSGISPDDRSVIGYTVPNYKFGIYNELKYKNLTLSFMINSIQGGGKGNYFMGNNSSQYEVNLWTPGAAGRVNIPDINYWSPSNPTNKYPSLNYEPTYAHGVYEDRSFVRLQDVTLTYNFSNSFVNRLGINGLKLYVSGKNLYTWTNFTGWDPEAGTTIADGYPVMRSMIVGLNINF